MVQALTICPAIKLNYDGFDNVPLNGGCGTEFIALAL